MHVISFDDVLGGRLGGREAAAAAAWAAAGCPLDATEPEVGLLFEDGPACFDTRVVEAAAAEVAGPEGAGAPPRAAAAAAAAARPPPPKRARGAQENIYTRASYQGHSDARVMHSQRRARGEVATRGAAAAAASGAGGGSASGGTASADTVPAAPPAPPAPKREPAPAGGATPRPVSAAGRPPVTPARPASAAGRAPAPAAVEAETAEAPKAAARPAAAAKPVAPKPSARPMAAPPRRTAAAAAPPPRRGKPAGKAAAVADAGRPDGWLPPGWGRTPRPPPPSGARRGSARDRELVVHAATGRTFESYLAARAFWEGAEGGGGDGLPVGWLVRSIEEFGIRSGVLATREVAVSPEGAVCHSWAEVRALLGAAAAEARGGAGSGGGAAAVPTAELARFVRAAATTPRVAFPPLADAGAATLLLMLQRLRAATFREEREGLRRRRGPRAGGRRGADRSGRRTPTSPPSVGVA